MELGQTGERVAQLPCSEHERDLLRKEAAGREPKHLRRSTIQPLRIINDTDQWLLLGRLGHEAEDRQSDQEPVRGRPTTEPERDAKRIALGLGETLHERKDRRAQLLNRRIRKLPSPPRPRTSGRSETPAPPRPRTAAARSCRRQALHAPPTPRRAHCAQPPTARQAPRTHAPDRVAARPAAGPVRALRSSRSQA